MASETKPVETKAVGNYLLAKVPVGPHIVYLWIRPDGTKADAPCDFNAIGAHVWGKLPGAPLLRTAEQLAAWRGV